MATGENLLVMGPSGSGKSSAAIVAIIDGLLKSPAGGASVFYLTDSDVTTAWMTELCQACGLLAASADDLETCSQGDSPDVVFVSPSRLEPQLTRGREFTGLRLVVIDGLSTAIGGTSGAHLNAVLERLCHRADSDPQRVALSPSLGDPEIALPWLCGGSQRGARLLRVPGAGGRRLLEVERIDRRMDLAEVTAVKVRGRRALVNVDSSQVLQRLHIGLEKRGVPCHGEGRDCQLTLGRPSSGATFQQVISMAPPCSVTELLSTLALTHRDPRSVSRVCLATQNDEDFLAACAAVSLAGQRWVEPASPEKGSWPVYLQQLIGRILAGHGITMDQALQDEGRPWALQDLGRPQRQEVLDHLLRENILEHAAGHLVLGVRAEATFDNALWRQTGKAFWKPVRYVTRNDEDSHTGSLDSWFLEAFPSFAYEQDERLWQVDARPRAGTVTVVPAKSGPIWHGSRRVYHGRFCAEIRALLHSDDSPVFLETRQLRDLQRLREQWRPLLARSSSKRLLSFAGARVNGFIAKLHHLLTGEKVAFSNLFVEVTGSLWPTLERLRDGLSAQHEQQLVAGCRQEKLLEYLPLEIRSAYLLGQLFDVEGARAAAADALKASSEEPAAAVREPALDYREEPLAGDVFFRQLVKLARTEITCNKWVFLPEVSLQWVLSERLLHAGVDWVNFRFSTPFQVALELAAPYLVQAGIHPKPEGLGPDLIIKLLLELAPSDDGYFRPLADQSGIARPLWKGVQELRMAGLCSEDLTVEMFTSAAKGREMKTLLAAYEDYLVQHRLGDRATVFRAALERIEEAPVGSRDLVLEYPSKPWSALERRFLDGLKGTPTAAWVAQDDPPRRWPLLCPRRELRPRAISQDSHLLGLLSTSQVAPAKNDGSLRFFCAGRRDAEVQEVLRRILDGGTPLDQIEIAVHDPDSLALLRDKLQKHDLAATFQDGLPVSATAPGRAVLGLLQWSEANFACFFLRELLLSGLLQVDGDYAPSSAARHLESAKATWGRATYALHLGQLEARYRALSQTKDRPPEEAASRAQQADGVARVARWTESLLARWPLAETEGRLPLGDLLDGLLSILTNDVPLRSALDRVAQASISRALRDLRLLAESSWTSQQCHRLVREKLESLTVGGGRPEAGKISVSSPLKMGRAGRSHLFLLGLEAGSLLPDTAEDAILCDQERRQIDETLELSTDRTAETRFRLAQQLGSLDGEVTLSYSCRDYRSGEELLPSRLFFDAARLLYPEVKDYDQLAQALGEPLSLAPPHPDQAAGDAEWWLAKLVGCGKESKTAVLTGFPWLSRGHLAQEQRESLLFTPYDGWVPQAAKLYDPRMTDKPISVSRLQDLAGCPYKTFLKTALALQPLELEQPDLDSWLSPAHRGTVLHETFAAYYRGLRSTGSRPAPEDLDQLVMLLESELAKIRQVVPAPSPAVESVERELLWRDLAHFLRLEMDESREVIGCEVGFGMAETFDEPLATVEPVVIDLGDDLRFSLRGRIDRIDRVDGCYEVIDYKTGSQLTDAAKPRYVHGELLQHALYALVAESLLAEQKGQVRASSYYFPVVRAKKSRIAFPYPDKAALAEVLSSVLEPLSTGAFAHTVRSAKHCGYCDFRAACVAQNDKGMLAKYEHSENAMLECRRRLRTIS
jgi:RecB family exonuclease/energy-coupling factor transporter ATP-binding protein EcfA2